jgi:hypothetical protein
MSTFYVDAVSDEPKPNITSIPVDQFDKEVETRRRLGIRGRVEYNLLFSGSARYVALVFI